MARYRKLSAVVLVDAVQWDGSADTADAFLGEYFGRDWAYSSKENSALLVPAPEGTMLCRVGDWIVKDAEGKYHVCRGDEFAANYEEVT